MNRDLSAYSGLHWRDMKNKTDPRHGCQRLGNGQGKSFIKVREFHFKSGKSEMLTVHFILVPFEQQVNVGFKQNQSYLHIIVKQFMYTLHDLLKCFMYHLPH